MDLSIIDVVLLNHVIVLTLSNASQPFSAYLSALLCLLLNPFVPPSYILLLNSLKVDHRIATPHSQRENRPQFLSLVPFAKGFKALIYQGVCPHDILANLSSRTSSHY